MRINRKRFVNKACFRQGHIWNCLFCTYVIMQAKLISRNLDVALKSIAKNPKYKNREI